jgi:hypothetical protein
MWGLWLHVGKLTNIKQGRCCCLLFWCLCIYLATVYTSHIAHALAKALAVAVGLAAHITYHSGSGSGAGSGSGREVFIFIGTYHDMHYASVHPAPDTALSKRARRTRLGHSHGHGHSHSLMLMPHS